MNKFVIMVDATSDVPKSFCEKYDIIVIPTHVKLPAGNEIMWQSDWDQYPRDKFYADLRKDPNGQQLRRQSQSSPITSRISPKRVRTSSSLLSPRV